MAVAGTTTNSAVTELTYAVMEVYSREILFASQPLLRFEQFAERKTDLSVAPGLTVNFLKYSDLTAGAALTEGTDMTKRALSSSQIQITVTEYGNAVSVTEKMLTASFDDVMSSSAKLLGFDYAKVLDGTLRDVVVGGSNVVYAGGKAGRSTIDGGDVMDTAAIKDAVENLATKKAPKVNGDAYVCFLHPHQARRIRDDSAWVNAANYGVNSQIYIGEIGRYEDVIFIETTMMSKILSTDGSTYNDNVDSGSNAATYSVSADIYQAAIFGDNAYGLAVSLPVEMRDDGVEDFGRKHSLAWYSIFGSGRIESDHVYRIETA